MENQKKREKVGSGVGSETGTLEELKEGVAGQRQTNREDPWAEETQTRCLREE